MTVALGITTWNRPDFAKVCVESVAEHLTGVVDYLFLYNDASEKKYAGSYADVYKSFEAIGGKVFDATENKGVAFAKNRLLEAMLETDADWFFLLEDDHAITDPKAITEYIATSERTGIHHLSFCHHGASTKEDYLVESSNGVDYFRLCGATYTSFSRECIEACGLFDERFYNAWEHIEHELRLMKDGFMPTCRANRHPDVHGSQHWVREQENANTLSSIRTPDGDKRQLDIGLLNWKTFHPDTYADFLGKDWGLWNWINEHRN